LISVCNTRKIREYLVPNCDIVSVATLLVSRILRTQEFWETSSSPASLIIKMTHHQLNVTHAAFGDSGLELAAQNSQVNPFLESPATHPESVTRLLSRMSDGDREAFDHLVPLVYQELHRIAEGYLRRELRNHTLQPTALIHEAYLRLVQSNGTDF